MLLFFILLAIIFKDYKEGEEMDGWDNGKFKIKRTKILSLWWFLC